MSENLKLKKVNKSFVPEPKESRQSVSSVFGFLYAYEHCECVLHICTFHILISGYVTLHQGVGKGDTPFPGLLHVV